MQEELRKTTPIIIERVFDISHILIKKEKVSVPLPRPNLLRVKYVKLSHIKAKSQKARSRQPDRCRLSTS